MILLCKSVDNASRMYFLCETKSVILARKKSDSTRVRNSTRDSFLGDQSRESNDNKAASCARGLENCAERTATKDTSVTFVPNPGRAPLQQFGI
jgi:hypothetical protein